MGYTNYGSSIIGGLADMKARAEAEKLRQKLIEEQKDQEEYDRAGAAQGGGLGALAGLAGAFLTGGASLPSLALGAASGYQAGTKAGRDPGGAAAGGFIGGYGAGNLGYNKDKDELKAEIMKNFDIKNTLDETTNTYKTLDQAKKFFNDANVVDLSSLYPGIFSKGTYGSRKAGTDIEFFNFLKANPEIAKQYGIYLSNNKIPSLGKQID